ncbi:MAG: DUF2442 domain-containing protein [Spirochaetes bacterium]|nr:DUF2442 domain-containing protein [Spirochaetota bacterium]
MKFSRGGIAASPVEVANIDQFGFWIIVGGREHFLPFKDFPWFRQATLDQILRVELLHDDHLRWPDLDVDLCLDSIEHPESYPLVYR